MTTLHVSVAMVHELARGLLIDAGVPWRGADTTARILLMADRWGLPSHGLLRLGWYLQRLHAGGVDPRAELITVHESTAAITYDGGAGLGQPQVWDAAERGVDLATEHGLSMVAVGNSSHSGCLGAYVVPALRRGLAAIVSCNGPAVMAPWGGSAPVYSTSPIAAGLPLPSEPAIVDMSLSAVARGRIAAAAQSRTPLPEGWAVAADGAPTRDPEAALTGMLTALGGAKGAALAFLVEALTGGLVGPALSHDVADMFDDDDRARPQRISHLVLTLDPALLDVDGRGSARLEELAQLVTSSGGRVPGATRLPLLDRAASDIEISTTTVIDLVDRAERRRIAVPAGLASSVATVTSAPR